MSRVSEYDDYDDDPIAILNYGRWERNSRAVLESKRGQKTLREIEAALLALPEPKLAYETFHKAEGEKVECCVLGAYARYKGVEMPEWLNGEDNSWTNPSSGEVEEDHEACPADDTASWATTGLGLTYTLAWNLVELNDRHHETEEQRYDRVLAWVRKNIQAPAHQGSAGQEDES